MLSIKENPSIQRDDIFVIFFSSQTKKNKFCEKKL